MQGTEGFLKRQTPLPILIIEVTVSVWCSDMFLFDYFLTSQFSGIKICLLLRHQKNDLSKRPTCNFGEHAQGRQDTDKSLVLGTVSPACDFQDHNQSTKFWRR